jgi:hypothetical protein
LAASPPLEVTGLLITYLCMTQSESSIANSAELPGFYFDTEKNRYFPIPKKGAAAGKGIPADGKRPQVCACTSLGIMTVTCVHAPHLGLPSMPNGGMHDSHHKRVPSATRMDFDPIVDDVLLSTMSFLQIPLVTGWERNHLSPPLSVLSKVAFRSVCRDKVPGGHKKESPEKARAVQTVCEVWPAGSGANMFAQGLRSWKQIPSFQVTCEESQDAASSQLVKPALLASQYSLLKRRELSGAFLHDAHASSGRRFTTKSWEASFRDYTVSCWFFTSVPSGSSFF